IERADRTRIGVVVVNYRAAELVRETAATLRAEGFTLAIADNSGELVGGADVVDCGTNIGFGAACNRAVAALDGHVTTVCFPNPGVVVDGDAVVRLAAQLDGHTGAVAPALRTGGRVRPDGYHYPSPARELVAGRRNARAAGGTGTDRAPLGPRSP